MWLRRAASGGKVRSVNPNVTYIYLHNRVPALTYRFTKEQFAQLADAGVLSWGDHTELLAGEVFTGGLPRRFTVEEFERMAEAGVLGEDERIELLNGELIHMSPIGYRHAQAVTLIGNFFARASAGRYQVSTQNPVQLFGNLKPQPDLVLVKPEVLRKHHHPRPAEILLLIEVSDSSFEYDHASKLPEYAKAEIAEYWIVNLLEDVIEIHRHPKFDHYEERLVVERGESAVCAAFPDIAMPVSEVIP